MEEVGGSRTVAYFVELCVGIACLIAAGGTRGSSSSRQVTAALRAMIALL